MRTETRTIHVVPHFHYDVAYLTTEAECLRVGLPNLVQALNLLDEHHDYYFMVEQIYLIEQLLHRRPGEWSRVSRHLSEGRLEIGGGFYVMADLNLISGESILAQVRIGRQVAEALRLPSMQGRVRVCWISDCWGHPFQMPQIAALCGYEGYAFCRGMLRQRNDSEDPLLPSEFIWEGSGGTAVIGMWLPEGYGPVPFLPDWFGAQGPPGALEVIERIADNVGRYASVPAVLLGNGGDNAPPQAALLMICRGSDTIRISTPSKYLDDVARYRDRLVRFRGEFNALFQGSYSARIPLKQRNRQLENLLETVRRYRAELQDRRASVDEQVRHAARLLAKLQAHDVIAGSTCDAVYFAAMKEFEEAEDMLIHAGGLVSRQELPSLDVQHWFNPSAFPRSELIDTRWVCSGVVDGAGHPLAVQQTFDGRTLCMATVPPLSTITLRPASSALVHETALRVYGECIENRYWKLRLSPAGGIASLTSKATGVEFVDNSRCDWNTLIFQWDLGDVYMHDRMPLDTRARASWFSTPHIDALPPTQSQTLSQTSARFSIQEDCRVDLLEKGPLRVLLRVTGVIRVWRVSVQFAQYIAVYADDPRIDFHTEIVPVGKHFRLRVAFPTTVRRGVIQHETAFGHVQRPDGEYPALNWMKYADREHAVCLINHGLPGNAVCEDVLLLSLFRSVALEYKCESDAAFGEQARFWFDYAVLPMDRRVSCCVVRAGEQFNRPVCPVPRPVERQSIRLESDTVMLSYWDGQELRLYESMGCWATARVIIAANAPCINAGASVLEVDCVGENARAVDLAGNVLTLSFSPFQIRTFRLVI